MEIKDDEFQNLNPANELIVMSNQRRETAESNNETKKLVTFSNDVHEIHYNQQYFPKFDDILENSETNEMNSKKLSEKKESSFQEFLK